MPTVTKAPQEPWPEALRGLEIDLLPGVHRAGELDGEPDMLIVGGEGVVIEGSIRPRGGEPACSLRIHDGAHRLRIIGPLELRGSEGRGLRITGAEAIAVSDLYVQQCRIEGIITGNCPSATYEAITVEDSRPPAPGYSADQLHGLYLSGDASNSRVTRLTVRRVTGSGLQLNGAGMDRILRRLQASQMVFERCGSGGTPPISMMGCQDCSITDFCADWTAGEKWAVLFADGKGPKYACVGNAFLNYTVPAGTICSEEQGSHNNSWDAGEGWSPGEPELPSNIDLALADIDDAKAAINSMMAQGNAALAFLADAEAALGGAT